jgi:hypothetical protein
MTDRRTHFFPASGDRVVTEQLSVGDFVASRQDEHGNTLFGYGATRLEAIADLVERIRTREASDA